MQAAIKLYLASSFEVIKCEQQNAASMVKRLEPNTREQLTRHFGDANAWRGLASDNLQTAYDIMKAFELALEVQGPTQTRNAPDQSQPTPAK